MAERSGIGWDGASGVPTNAKFGGIFGHHHPYAADDLADRSTRVRNFPTVDGKYREIGDIAAFHAVGPGHATLYLGAGMCIYAGEAGVTINSIALFQSGHDNVTYRRYRP